MADDLKPIGDFVSLQTPNAIGKKPIVRGRKPRQRSKAEVRDIVGGFIERNAGHLETWLAEIYEKQGAAAAFDRLAGLLEYSTPKLQRREVTGADEGPQEFRISWAGRDDSGD